MQSSLWRFVCALMACLSPAVAQPQDLAKTDHAALTQEFHAAVTRGDAAAAGRLLCAQALVISPRGIVSTRAGSLTWPASADTSKNPAVPSAPAL